MDTRRISLLVAAVTLAALALLPLTAGALSDQQACEQSGGVYSNDQGTKSCTYSDAPGNNQGGVVKTDTDSQKGSFSSSHPTTTSDCVNNNGGSHC